VIEAHLAEGNVGEALRQYERCRAQLEQELGVCPSTAVTALLPVDPELLHRTPAVLSRGGRMVSETGTFGEGCVQT
jgi:DNA-binding SARP family transcriptional activator